MQPRLDAVAWIVLCWVALFWAGWFCAWRFWSEFSSCTLGWIVLGGSFLVLFFAAFFFFSRTFLKNRQFLRKAIEIVEFLPHHHVCNYSLTNNILNAICMDVS
jgi:hypothetical protein